jgi:hypothetical protein
LRKTGFEPSKQIFPNAERPLRPLGVLRFVQPSEIFIEICGCAQTLRAFLGVQQPNITI